jgi:hypothetical protein
MNQICFVSNCILFTEMLYRPTRVSQQLSAMYEGCPESIRLFLITREQVWWPYCNLAACQRRPDCASVNSHSPKWLVSWQQDAGDGACVPCDRRIHKSPSFQRQF